MNENNLLKVNKIENNLLKKDYSDEEINERISKGIDLDNNFALYLLGTGKEKLLVDNLGKFQDLNQEIALKLIEKGNGYPMAFNLKKFNNLNYQEIALKLIEKGNGGAVADNIEEFQDLTQEIALILISQGDGKAVINNLEKFPNLDLTQEITLRIISQGNGNAVIKHLEKLKNLNRKEITFKLIEKGYGESVINNLENFQDISDQELALKLIRGIINVSAVINNFKKFNNLNYQEIALKLIATGNGRDVINNLENFQDISHQEIALKLIEKGNSREVVDNLEKFKNLNQETVLILIEKGYTKQVVQNLEKFQLSPQKFYQAVKEKYSNFITDIEIKIPKLAEPLSRSVELLLDILDIKDKFANIEKFIDDNPFLLEALEENPRYGSKLILKYQEFDKTSKKNIKELFENEIEIIKANPSIDKDSVEFRQLMQEKLMSFSGNKKIFSELENRGINTNEWLNYNEQSHFTLGEQENVKFSDQIKTPIIRIKETLNKYQESIVNTLLNYKTELQASFVTNQEAEELKQKIIDLKQRIGTEADEKKIQGMQRGLASLEAKEATLKSANVWSKVQSDLFRLNSMTENIFKFHDACVQIETKIETSKDRKELIKEKDNLEKNKAQLSDNFKDFELFFESYEVKLQELIIPILGKERSSALLQEIKAAIGEELNHYDTDKNTLKNIFNEKEKDEDNLNGREMKISISSRSTQDLYLGNYCPCCVCIDSEYHGAMSPIADYVTDLGIQNIVVYDEKTNVPVVVCWTFIGENKANGDPIMVIDNIEANTGYTKKYPDQLKEVIFKYISDYTKAVNIKHTVQGPSNNDLIVFPLEKVSRKLGGKYNRADGYFLEAESYDDDEDEN